MPACDGNYYTADCNSPRCSTSNAGGTTGLLENQRLGSALSEGLGPLADGVGNPPISFIPAYPSDLPNGCPKRLSYLSPILPNTNAGFTLASV